MVKITKKNIFNKNLNKQMKMKMKMKNKNYKIYFYLMNKDFFKKIKIQLI